MSLSLPSSAVRASLRSTASTLLDSWISGSSDEYLGDARWIWNASEAGSEDTYEDKKLGASALAAALHRVGGSDSYRVAAIDTIDTYFANYQNADGSIHRTGSTTANNIAAHFALVNISLAAQAIGTGRWNARILAVVDYLKGAGEDTYYPNGNLALASAVGAYSAYIASGLNFDRYVDFTEAVEFLYVPYDVEPGSWEGFGYIEEVPAVLDDASDGRGYFSEVVGPITPASDISGDNRFDADYTQLQMDFASVGYLLSGHRLFRRILNRLINKMVTVRTDATNVFTSVGGSRQPDAVFPMLSPGFAVAAWLTGRTDLSSYLTTYLDHASNGLMVQYAGKATTTDANFYFKSGPHLGGALLASHGLSGADLSPPHRVTLTNRAGRGLQRAVGRPVGARR